MPIISPSDIVLCGVIIFLLTIVTRKADDVNLGFGLLTTGFIILLISVVLELILGGVSFFDSSTGSIKTTLGGSTSVSVGIGLIISGGLIVVRGLWRQKKK